MATLSSKGRSDVVEIGWPAMANVLVLGGGFGGAQVAIAARELLGDDHRITVVDRADRSLLCGANPLMVVGERPREGVSRSMSTLRQRGVEVVTDEIVAIDLQRRTADTSRDEFPFDYLVVALGAVYDLDAVPGSSAAHSFYDHAGSVLLREAVERFEGGRVVIGIAGTPYKCPPAPLEAALLLEWHFRRRGLSAEIHLYIPEPAPLAVAGPATSKRVGEMLAARGVVLHTQTTVAVVENMGREVHFSDGASLDADLAVVVPAHRVPAVVTSSGLTREKPWVPVDPRTLETTAASGVFAVGDVNSVPIGSDRALPKAGVFASAQGRHVAETITSRILGTSSPAPYTGEGSCFFLLSGEEVAEVGGVFLAPGGPQVGLGEPQPAAVEERWEDNWLRYAI
ncbi:MAG TPA: FAD/NAD(P)-binding oxidoreductase [Acidimicrobiia bacterium]|nr:FAD/NAD(P)-binding oxidoreductase [Acidimicrobiia bacterium]